MSVEEAATGMESDCHVAIGLGANLGERQAALRRAGWSLEILLSNLRWSSLYETEPRERADQPRFLNACCTGRTTLEPRRLLEELHALERAEGRRRDRRRYGPRVLDLDLLLYGSLRLQTDEVTIPHPKLSERAFVLIPLSEVAPEWRVPGFGLSVVVLRERLPDQGVRWVASPASWLAAGE